ncbi:YchF/TatD family DNA exonuclease [bacterium]|nr:YchF/TatD family DNA exonuclease [bacterium]
MPFFFDTHAHVQNEKFAADREAVLARARMAGVRRILNLGTRLADSREVVELAHKHRDCLAAVGVHPTDLDAWSEAEAKGLMQLAEDPQVVVYGEIGLDYYWDKFERNFQRDIFRRQLGMARELRLPVSMHCRGEGCYADLIEDLRAERGEEIGGVAHCFGGTMDEAKALVDMGFALGVGGTSTFPKSDDIRAILRTIGIDHLIIETDSPYLSPQPRRGKRNEPAHVVHTAQGLADLFGLDLRDIAHLTWCNATGAFRLPKSARLMPLEVRGDALCIHLTAMCPEKRGHRLERVLRSSEIIPKLGREDFAACSEVVFCEAGEPFVRIDTIAEVGKALRDAGKRVAVRADGLAEQHLREPLDFRIASDCVDALRVVLNAHDAESYARFCHPGEAASAFEAILQFITHAKPHFDDIAITCLDADDVDADAMRKLGTELGVAVEFENALD